MAEPWVGRPLTRREDLRFVTGHATYVGDLPAEGALHLGFVRSPSAHARLGAIDAGAAMALDGVAAVVTAADLEGRWDPYGIAAAEGSQVATVPLPLLGSGTVRFVGEPVAAVLAETPALVEDALELVLVDYDDLPPVADVE
ncbi:MAG TPA: xanthine dehydrogenase family protein molybdopterin-binding subunit, partial [Actinomycetota bacterium]|nr:xanthine dehydrogenase family protein molybdopterin-binding subunit [Actinomycetota bacterium]